MIKDKETREALYKQLEELDSKADWEGGLVEMILSYGGWDMFPETCQKPLMALVEAHSALQVELRRLSKACAYEASLW